MESDVAGNESAYGDLTRLNKDQARQQFGTDQVHAWRRSHAVAPPQWRAEPRPQMHRCEKSTLF